MLDILGVVLKTESSFSDVKTWDMSTIWGSILRMASIIIVIIFIKNVFVT